MNEEGSEEADAIMRRRRETMLTARNDISDDPIAPTPQQPAKPPGGLAGTSPTQTAPVSQNPVTPPATQQPTTPTTGQPTAPTPTPATGQQGASGPGDPTYKLSGSDITALLTARPDIEQAYQQALKTADRNSPAFAEAGLGSLETYAQHWYGGMGGYQQWNPTGSSASGQGGDIITNLTNGFNDTIKALQQQTQAQIAALQQQNQAVTGSVQQQQQQFAQSQQQLLDQMTKAAAEQSKAFTAALKGMTDSAAATGQQSKKPNYGRALQRNKELNGQGLGSTMLTGPGGVAPGTMSLGFTSLVGA